MEAEEDLRKIIKKERRRLAKKKRLFREEVRIKYMELVKKKIDDMRRYLRERCKEKGAKGEVEEREGV